MTGSLRVVILKLVLFTAITLSLTGLLAAVIGNIQPFTRFYDVKAEFSDATGVLAQDVVKVAGVTVGKVSGLRVEVDEDTGRARALMTLRVRKDVNVPRNAQAAIRFRNLLGQRMVVLSRDEKAPDAPALAKDGSALIPLDRTKPAFDLGIVFNNLRPVLRTLNPEDVNIVSRAIIQVFSGREERVQKMVSDLADLAEALEARGPIVTDLVTNLADAAKTIAARDQELRSVIDSLDSIAFTLAGRGDELARAADNLGVASEGTAEVIANNRPGLDRTIDQLRQILAIVAEHKDELDVALQNLPRTVHALNRATTYGEWGNLNAVCINDICGSGFSSSGVSASRDGDGLARLLLGGDR